jgi:peptide/nickel transport system permease protein
MIRYLLKRVLWGLVTLFIFITVIFFATQILLPGDFASQYRLFLSGEEVSQLREEMGLDLPLWKQYLGWLGLLLRGNLGTSYQGVSVSDILVTVLPLTLFLFGLGTLLAFLLGQWLGKVTAWHRSRLSSGAATFGAIMLYTSFPPWLAFLMTYFVGRRLQLVRNVFDLQPTRLIWYDSTVSAVTVLWYMLATIAALALGLALVNRILQRTSERRLRVSLGHTPSLLVLIVGPPALWYALGFGPQAMDIVLVLALPLVTFVLLTFGETLLIMRTSMMDTVHEEYIFTARAKGLSEQVVRDKHAARNALLPVLSRLVTSIPYLLTGLVIIEYSFGFSKRSGLATLNASPDTWGGLGSAMFGALVNQDMLVVVGMLLAVGLLSLVARLLLDVLHALLDPRIRYRASSIEEVG